MFKKISIQALVILLAAGPLASTYASIAPERSVVIDTQPKAFVPSVTLQDVTGTFSNVTEVKIQFGDAANTEVQLQDMGAKTWHAPLSAEQVKILLGSKTSETYPAKLIIRSKNDKGRTEVKVKDIQVTVQGQS
jgi:hypothetical protein